MNIPVTSVSKKEQKLSQAGAAIFVITQEDIRRSGATNIPDLLRLVPGVDVARVDANRWAVSIRGFSDQYANKVQVLIDGRSVYNTSFSGVFWDMEQVPLDDIERIEVIRGPGGTVWGANAVNGVINIITKSAKGTKGGLITAGGGPEDHVDALVQYGGSLGQTGDYRVYGRYFDIDSSPLATGGPGSDGWMAGQGGFRSDWVLSPRDSLTIQGDFLKTNGGQALTTSFSNALPQVETLSDVVTGTTGNVLGRWTHTLADGSQMSLQIYEDYWRHFEQGFSDALNTVDLDFQDHMSVGSRNDVVWGLGARAMDSSFGTGYVFSILPSHQWEGLFSAFLQDELRVTDSLSITLGSKVEHNKFTGFEYSPSAQLVWAITAKQTLWASAARAIREPSTGDEGIQRVEAIVPAGPTFGVIELDGNPKLQAEVLRDFETGYRSQAIRHLSLDVTAFTSFYRNLQTAVPQTPYLAYQQGLPYLVLPQLLMNAAGARSYGAEFSGNWNVMHGWRLSPGYSFLHINVNGYTAGLTSPPGASPNHQFQVRSLLDLPHHLEWDNTLGFVSKLALGEVPAYARLDSRLGWRVGEFIELSVVGQNLLTPRHAEFFDYYGVNHTLVDRSVFAKVTWRF